jgi:16S rRNA (uracil1498-N3)-methyltransferase
MRRFFFDSANNDGDIVCLDENESRHITRALRLTAGDEVELLDGSGNIYGAVITETGKTVRARIVRSVEGVSTDFARLIICQGQLKGKKMDVVVQKATELGVTRMAPFWSSRCQGKLNDLQGAKKLDRYLRIVESACKQCYRPDLMAVDQPLDLSELLASFPDEPGRMRLLCWEEEKSVSLHDIDFPESIGEVVLLLGPEGGLAAVEVEHARALGWQTVSLGKRILRAETATITAASILQFLLRNI